MNNRNDVRITLGLAVLFLTGAWFFRAYAIIPPSAPVVRPISAQLPAAISRLPFISSLPISKSVFPTVPERIDTIADVILNVDAAYAITDQGEVLFDQRGSKVLPIASITKVLTALVAVKLLSMDADVVITQSAISTDGNLGGLYRGETLSLHDALLAMLLPSSNDAAVAIAEATGDMKEFVSAMNETANTLGIVGSRFNNVHGLSPPGNFSSAQGVAAMMHAALKNPALAQMLHQPSVEVYSKEGIVHVFTHRANGLTAYPGVLGLKTGYTDESRGTLVMAFRPDPRSDRVVVTVILGSDERAVDTEALATWVRGAYRWPLATEIIAIR